MPLYSKKTVKQLLFEYNLRAQKRLGQHFLIHKKILDKIVAAAALTSSDIVVEIGPGLGVLTAAISTKANRVIAIEKDRNMLEVLKERLADCPHIKLISADILCWNPKDELSGKKYKVVANIPYYITAPLIKKFLEQVEIRPQLMVLMVQKEVAQRICAKPPHMNLLAVAVQFYANPSIVAYVKKSSFWPQPKVDSAILKLTPYPVAPISQTANIQKTRSSGFFDGTARELFFKIVRAGFRQPRKQLINNLSKGCKLSKEAVSIWLRSCGIQPTQRPETLSIEDWIKLFRYFETSK